MISLAHFIYIKITKLIYTVYTVIKGFKIWC